MTPTDNRTDFQAQMCHHLAHGQVAEADALNLRRCPACAGASFDDGCDTCDGVGMIAAGVVRDGETAAEAVARVESIVLRVASTVDAYGGEIVGIVTGWSDVPAVTVTRAIRRLVASGKLTVVRTETVYRTASNTTPDAS